MIKIIRHPEDAKRLGNFLIEGLQSDIWTSFRAAIAFAKRSGVKHIAKDLSEFAQRATVKISIGIDHSGTSAEAISDLLAALQPYGELWVFHNAAAINTFHPKIYLFENAGAAECFIGSGNLTEGGLFTNYETFVHLCLDRENAEQRDVLELIEGSLNDFTDGAKGTALQVSDKLIVDLTANGNLPTEAEIKERTKAVTNKVAPSGSAVDVKKFFASVQVPAAPRVISGVIAVTKDGTTVAVPPQPAAMAVPAQVGFVITLQKTDIGVGQVTKGTSRRSPELFLPVVCVRENPKFWGWPDLFASDPNYDGTY